jgi:hypothetical protein
MFGQEGMLLVVVGFLPTANTDTAGWLLLRH